MRISDWSSDVCSSDLQSGLPAGKTFATFDFDAAPGIRKPHLLSLAAGDDWIESGGNLLLFGQSGTGKTHAVAAIGHALIDTRSEEHTSELQSLMRISYAVFCLKKKKKRHHTSYIEKKSDTRRTNDTRDQGERQANKKR